MKIDEILTMMDGLLDKSTAVPFSNKRMIDAEQMREYLDSIRFNMPEEINKAKETENEYKNIIADANREAEQIIRQAEEKAKAMVAQEEIIKQAREIAKQELEKAKQEADATIAEAKPMADQIVGDAKTQEKRIKKALADTLEKTLIDTERTLQKCTADVTATKNAVLRVGGAPDEQPAPAQAPTPIDKIKEKRRFNKD